MTEAGETASTALFSTEDAKVEPGSVPVGAPRAGLARGRGSGRTDRRTAFEERVSILLSLSKSLPVSSPNFH